MKRLQDDRWARRPRSTGEHAGSAGVSPTKVIRLAALLLLCSGPLATAAGPDNPDDPPTPAEIERSLGESDPANSGPPSFEQDIVVPFIAEGGHLIVDVSLDGQPPRPFFFDSGARIIVTPDIADQLQTRSVDDHRFMSGIGPHVVETSTVTLRRMSLGTAVLDDQTVFVGPLRNGLIDRGNRPRIAGLIGAELLRKYVARIDYGRRQLTLIPPGRFQPPEGAIALPLTVQITRDGLFQAMVPIRVDHVPARVLIDTGSSGQIHLAPGFERTQRLFDRYAKVISVMTPGGIGGRAHMRMGIGQEVALGDAAVALPVVTTPEPDDDGAGVGMGRVRGRGAAYGLSDGLLGNGVLARFVVTLDYKGNFAYFEPRPDLSPPRSVLMGTGLFLDKPDHDGFEIIDVLAGTAAERAGLQIGQRIVAVNGQPARDLGLADIKPTAQQEVTVELEDGRHIALAVGQMLP